MDTRTYTRHDGEILGSGIVGRMGGKKLLKKKIVERFPKGYEDMTYIEPFVGGGNILLEKNKSKHEIVNDLDSDLISIYKGFKENPIAIIKKDINKEYTKEDFKKIKDSNPTSDYGKFVKNFLLTRLSFFSLGKSWGGMGKVNLKQDYGERLEDTTIKNEDYKKLIKDYNGKDSFFYFDPPYEGSTDKHYKVIEKGTSFDYDEFKKEIDSINKKHGKFMISINDSPFLRELFQDYNIETVKTKYTDALKGGQTKEKNELIITNYDTGQDYDTKHIIPEKQEHEDKMKKLLEDHFTYKPKEPKEQEELNFDLLGDEDMTPISNPKTKNDFEKFLEHHNINIIEDDESIGRVSKSKGKKRTTNNEI
jgi:DNA adenine methylase